MRGICYQDARTPRGEGGGEVLTSHPAPKHVIAARDAERVGDEVAHQPGVALIRSLAKDESDTHMGDGFSLTLGRHHPHESR